MGFSMMNSFDYGARFIRWLKWSVVVYVGTIFLSLLACTLFAWVYYLIYQPQLTGHTAQVFKQPTSATEWFFFSLVTSFNLAAPVIIYGTLAFFAFAFLLLLAFVWCARSFALTPLAPVERELPKSNPSERDAK